jgi:hypothetical protein
VLRYGSVSFRREDMGAAFHLHIINICVHIKKDFDYLFFTIRFAIIYLLHYLHHFQEVILGQITCGLDCSFLSMDTKNEIHICRLFGVT